MSSGISGLERLPPELLQEIATLVRSVSTSSFVSLSWTSKVIRAACFRILFSHVVFETPSRSEVDRCLEDLSKNQLLGHARHLTLLGKKNRFNENRECRVLQIPGAHEVDQREIDRYLELQWTRQFSANHIILTNWNWKPPQEYRDDPKWAPVIDLLEAMPNLTHLHFNWDDEVFPRCLLDYLVAYMPSCRLSLARLDFPCSSYDDDTITDPRAVAIATCPNLYEVGAIFYCPQDVVANGTNYGDQAIMAMAMGAAPNLTSLGVIAESPESESNGVRIRQRRKPFAGFPGAHAPLRKAPITSFHLDSDFGLREWDPSIDYSLLQSLSVGAYQLNDQNNLLWLARIVELPSLKKLSLAAGDYYEPQGTDEETGEKMNVLGEILERLPPLEELQLRNYCGVEPGLLKDMIHRHGPTLRALRLVTFPHESFDRNVMQKLGATCQMLQELEIPVKRSCGDADEAAIYTSLGRIKTLRRATLQLSPGRITPDGILSRDTDVVEHRALVRWAWSPQGLSTRSKPGLPWSNFDYLLPAMSDRDYQEFPVLNGDLRNAFINHAVDATLAKAIWDRFHRLDILVIESAAYKDLQHPPIGPEWEAFGSMIEKMRGSFILQRSILNEEVVLVEKLPMDGSGGGWKASRPQEDRSIPEDIHPMVVFRKIWPKKSESQGWEHDWSSLPLAG